MPATDIWPDFQPPETIDSPVFLLKELAAQLKQKTKGLVVAGLRPASTPEGGFWVGFDLSSPALGAYIYRLFEVTYPLQFFPVTVNAMGQTREAQSMNQLRTLLEEVLRSPQTKQVVEAIMAQATALGPIDAD